MHLSLVILAAGIGKRFGGLKQIEPVGPRNELIVDYSIYDALKAGFTDVVFIIREDMAITFADLIGRRVARHVPVSYVYQDQINQEFHGRSLPARGKPWGTGHALLTCQAQVNNPFAVINADDYYGPQSYRLLADMIRQTVADSSSGIRPAGVPEVYTMIAYQLANTLSEFGTVSRGICQVDDQGGLKQIDECRGIVKTESGAKYPVSDTEWRHCSGTELVSMNLWGFTPAVFPQLAKLFHDFIRDNGNHPDAEFFLPTAIDCLIKNHQARVRVTISPEKWFGITYTQDLASVKGYISEQIAGGQYPRSLWE